MVSQDRHAGCEQLDGESDDGLYANSGKLGLDEPADDGRLARIQAKAAPSRTTSARTPPDIGVAGFRAVSYGGWRKARMRDGWGRRPRCGGAVADLCIEPALEQREMIGNGERLTSIGVEEAERAERWPRCMSLAFPTTYCRSTVNRALTSSAKKSRRPSATG